MPTTALDGNGKKHASPQSLNAAVKSICDIMRRSNCAGAMKYVPELTWILFLRILDERENGEAEEAQALGLPATPSLNAPYRWRDWAAPDSAMRQDKNASVWKFVHEQLLPHLRDLEDQPGASPRQKIISEVMSGVERSRIDSEKNFLDVLDKVHDLSNETIDQTHVFTLSQIYEGLLLKMGEKGNDGGQFFTPREIIRVMVRVVKPEIGKTVYDPGCGTGGFLAQAFEYMREQAEESGTLDATKLELLKRNTFFGREKDNDVYPIALANLLLHGIDQPRIWHGNTLSNQEAYADLFRGAPEFFDYVLMNPPFGGKEGKEAQTGFDYPTSATQVLFLQHVLKSMKDGSVCGIVLDEGVLFKTNDDGFVNTKRKLLEEADVYCIVSLPGGVFSAAGAGVKTNLVFFRKGRQTEKIWYYDLSDVKVGKKKPLTRGAFDVFFQLLPAHGDSERSWSIDFAKRLQQSLDESRPFHEKAAQLAAEAKSLELAVRDERKSKTATPHDLAQAEEAWKKAERETRESKSKAKDIEDAIYDIKAVNPNRKAEEDTRTPAELLDFIESKGREADAALTRLRQLTSQNSAGEQDALRNLTENPRTTEFSARSLEKE